MDYRIEKEIGTEIRFKTPTYAALSKSILSEFPGLFILSPGFGLKGGEFRKEAMVINI